MSDDKERKWVKKLSQNKHLIYIKILGLWEKQIIRCSLLNKESLETCQKFLKMLVI